jgi:hypothetical protein
MYRNKAFLRAVASLPCQLCGKENETQAAHANWSEYGKGMALKAHDCYVAALCVSCHHNIDQGSKLNYGERKELWEAAWRKTIRELFEQNLVGTK